MEERLPRKLVAILYADVAGYSRLTGDDEDATQGMPFWQSSMPSSMHCHRLSLSKTNSKIVIKICPTNARYSFESATKPGVGGQTVLELTPFELLDRLAVLIAPPRRHRHRYHGILAPVCP